MRLFLVYAVNGLLLPLYLVFMLLSFLLAFVPIFPVRVGYTNLRERLGLGPWQARIAMARVFMHYIYYVIEALFLWPLGLVVTDEEDEFLLFMQRMVKKYQMDQGRGFLMLGGHYGNIEICGRSLKRVLGRLGKKFVVLAKPSKNPLVNLLIALFRRVHGFDMLLTGNADLLRVMLAQARQGTSLALVVDQKPRKGGVFVRFLGAFSAFPAHGAAVGLRTGSPFIHVNARRKVPGHFKLVFAEGCNRHLPAYTADERVQGNVPCEEREAILTGLTATELEVAPVLALFTGWLEGIIAESPTQWFWDYRKWSRQPQATSP